MHVYVSGWASAKCSWVPQRSDEGIGPGGTGVTGLQVVMNLPVRLLGTELRSSLRAARVWATFPAARYVFKKDFKNDIHFYWLLLIQITKELNFHKTGVDKQVLENLKVLCFSPDNWQNSKQNNFLWAKSVTALWKSWRYTRFIEAMLERVWV